MSDARIFADLTDTELVVRVPREWAAAFVEIVTTGAACYTGCPVPPTPRFLARTAQAIEDCAWPGTEGDDADSESA